jgi:MYXO-CTERM domain-containing protein
VTRTRRVPGIAIFSTLAALVGCGGDPGGEEAFGSLEQPIVNGSTDNGDPAVVGLTTQGQQFCTGTLIRPTVVVTAAHCLPPNLGDFGISSYSQIDVFFGTSVGSGEFIQAVDGFTHPGWNNDVIEDDIGLLRLSSPGPATPIPFATQQMTFSDQGASVRLVGFGITQEGANDSGLKRQGNTTIAEVFSFVFTMAENPSVTCSGDSGGSTLMIRDGVETLVGIHSRSDCVSEAIDTRVDDYNDIINDFIGEVPEPSCGADGQCASGCASPDPDCPCAGDGFCTDACGMPETDPDCTIDCSANGTCNPACTEANPDPDCGSEPPPTEECPDGNCGWVAGDADDENPKGTIVSSCAAAPGSDMSSHAWWLAALGVAALTRRSRFRREG